MGYNPNQPRHPAGSDQGGEWAPAHGGGGSQAGEQPVSLAIGGRRGSRRLEAISAHRASLQFQNKSKAEWAKEAVEKKEKWRELNEKALAAGKVADDARKELMARMSADLKPIREEYDRANKECGDAWKEVAATLPPNSTMPEPGSPAFNRLSERAQAAVVRYKETQVASEKASSERWKAQDAWLKANDGHVRQLQDEYQKVSDAARAMDSEARLAANAVEQYDKTVTRAAQTSVEAREPRETEATAYSAITPATEAAIIAAREGKTGYNDTNIYVTHVPKDDPRMLAKAKELGVAPDQVPFEQRPVMYRIGDTEVKIEPNFKATIKDAGDFKKKMGKLFEGASIEGVPRDASPHMLTIVHDEFRALRDEFPEVAVRTIKLNAGGGGARAWSGDDKITFGREGIESFERAHLSFGSGKLRETPDVEPDFHDGTRSYGSVVRHEFAHQLHFQHPEVLKEFDREVSALPREVRTKITGYARKNNYERFAETFTLMKYGDKGSKNHPAVQIMTRVVKNYFKTKRSAKP